MPAKIARSAPRPSLGPARAAGSHPHLASVLQQGRKSANISARSGVIWGIPDYIILDNFNVAERDSRLKAFSFMRIHQHSQAFLKIILHHSNALVFLISLSFSAAAQEAEIVKPRGALAAGTVAAVATANAAGSSVAWPLHLSTQGKYLE
jgi:hypothetical protein